MSLQQTLRRAAELFRDRPTARPIPGDLDDVLRAELRGREHELEFYRVWLPAERRQGRFFAKLMVEHLPPQLAKEIRRNRWSMLDVGCACGHLVDRLASAFPRSTVAGVDVDSPRIALARRYYPERTFRLADVRNMTTRPAYDVVFTSNVLEHFPSPIETLAHHLAPLARHHVVSLVPWQEDPRIEGHLHTFTEGSFPERLGPFRLSSMTLVDCSVLDRESWPGWQALTVYEREAGS